MILWVYAAIAQLVERIHGKDEVTGSSPVRGSIFLCKKHPGGILQRDNLGDL